MNRPDLDALEREYVAPNNDEGEDVKELIAYARHLEAQITAYEDEVYSANLAHNEYEARISELEAARTVLPGEVFDQILNDISEGEIEALNRRISELEAALEPYVTHAHSNAARVLRKGE